MKKPAFYLIFLIPIAALSADPPASGAADHPAAVPIETNLFLLFTAGAAFGAYAIFKKK